VTRGAYQPKFLVDQPPSAKDLLIYVLCLTTCIFQAKKTL